MNDRRDATFLTPREREIFGAALEILQDALKQRDERIGELLTRVAALEAKTPADWVKGSWLADTRYRRGETVQKGNAAYVCMADNINEDPRQSSSWRLQAGGR